MSDAKLELLGRLVGSWTTEATHPMMPGVVVKGSVTVEWLEGERFLIHRARADHPDFPDSISILGFTDQDRVEKGARAAAAGDQPMQMHYYDSRGVYRVYQASIDDAAWKLWRDAPELSQRFTGTISDGGNTVAGVWQMRADDVTWKDDLQITYRRR